MEKGVIITKKELSEQVAEKIGSVPKLYSIIGAVFECIAENLASGNEVVIRDFGKFKVIERRERKGTNPRTGEEIVIQAHKSPIFKASKTFKDAVN